MVGSIERNRRPGSSPRPSRTRASPCSSRGSPRQSARARTRLWRRRASRRSRRNRPWICSSWTRKPSTTGKASRWNRFCRRRSLRRRSFSRSMTTMITSRATRRPSIPTAASCSWRKSIAMGRRGALDREEQRNLLAVHPARAIHDGGEQREPAGRLCGQSVGAGVRFVPAAPAPCSTGLNAPCWTRATPSSTPRPRRLMRTWPKSTGRRM
uniref:(northern house mosquito) hypothetical protein n=1 Tax=Culex pipiens TaxID=7175 RepID=A0A8D8KCR1_CULPI